MLRTALKRLVQDEDGFTLVELMVVIVILSILIVMGLPTFLGVKARFQDRGAQTDLRNAVLSARILFTDSATFTSANEGGAGLVTVVPNMCYVAGGTASIATGTVPCASGAGGGSISVASTATQFSAARMSASTSCFVILDAATGTKYGKTTAANCDAGWAGAAGNVTATTPSAGGW
jgi:prepilin-type N-terminal cleavage/methylation domain-containing protein